MTVRAKLYVTGIGPHWRRMYRRHRQHGFTPEQATLAVYGGIYAARSMSATIARAFDADVRLETLNRTPDNEPPTPEAA